MESQSLIYIPLFNRKFIKFSIFFMYILLMGYGGHQKANDFIASDTDSLKIESESQKLISQGEPIPYDSVKLEAISVSNVKLRSNVSNLLSKLGKPDTIVRQKNDFDDSEFFDYVYGKSNFSVSQGLISGFDIYDTNYVFDYKSIRIGDEESILKDLFPNSYSRKFTNGNENIIKVKIVGLSDDYILFKVKEDHIIGYLLWENW